MSSPPGSPGTSGRGRPIAQRVQLPADGAPPALRGIIGQREVHVWRLTPEAAAPSVLLPLLSADERERAWRYRFARDREAFILARGLLRCIFGQYLARRPEDIRLCYGPYGKPALPPAPGQDDLRFNLAHTDGLALLAVSRGRELGVDVERVRPGFAAETIAERFFSAREVAALRALPVAEQDTAFFHCWTRKEAYIKARGEGLSIPLDSFDVTLGQKEPPKLLRVVGAPEETTRWSLHDLDAGSGYCAALVVEGADVRITWVDPALPDTPRDRPFAATMVGHGASFPAPPHEDADAI